MTALDFPVTARTTVASRDELASLFRDSAVTAVRLCGTGASQDRLPVPADPVQLVSLAPMQRIVRLDVPDLTCSVEPGLARSDLDAELARHRLAFPCPGTGTIGGLLARGEHQPLAPGAPTARSLVLGLEGVLTDGTRFKVGARVVKSVAGFDLHRAFVGSRGRLFAGTLFHLKLRPAPHATFAFARSGLDGETALRTYQHLRQVPAAPATLVLQRLGSQGFTVAGVVEGAPPHVRALRSRLELPEAAAPDYGLTDVVGEEVVAGSVPPSRAGALLRELPEGAPVQLWGTGQFLVRLRPAATDRCLAWLAEVPGAHGEVQNGAAERRGRATPRDVGAARVEAALRASLDPRGLLR